MMQVLKFILSNSLLQDGRMKRSTMLLKLPKQWVPKVCTDEIGEEAVKKLGPFAEKHGMYAIFHNHMQFATAGFSYDPFLAVSPQL